MYRILALETNEYLLGAISNVTTPPRLILYSNYEKNRRLQQEWTATCKLYEVESVDTALDDLKYTLSLIAGIKLSEDIIYSTSKYSDTKQHFTFKEIKPYFEVVEV